MAWHISKVTGAFMLRQSPLQMGKQGLVKNHRYKPVKAGEKTDPSVGAFDGNFCGSPP